MSASHRRPPDARHYQLMLFARRIGMVALISAGLVLLGAVGSCQLPKPQIPSIGAAPVAPAAADRSPNGRAPAGRASISRDPGGRATFVRA